MSDRTVIKLDWKKLLTILRLIKMNRRIEKFYAKWDLSIWKLWTTRSE